MADARAAYREAMRLAEAGLTVNPTNADALASAAVFAAKAGEWPTARERLRAAQQLAPDNVQVTFRAAVLHALSGETAAALDALESAVHLGFSRTTIAADEDFTALKKMPRFKALVDEAPSNGRPR